MITRSSNIHSLEKRKAFAPEKALNLPYLRNITQEVAQSFVTKRTPEFFLITAQVSFATAVLSMVTPRMRVP
jgi:hypothetical protein